VSHQVIEAAQDAEVEFDVIVVGAGISGLYALYQLRRRGYRVHVLERASGVGGTWFWNRYPGARCDIESVDYAYAFSDELRAEWRWSERYATQPEILRYLNYVTDRFDLRRSIQFNCDVKAMTFDEDHCRWIVTTASGDTLSARFCILGVGNLSEPKAPAFDGLDQFCGATYVTGRWPDEAITWDQKRVGVIGTGSSGIQVVTELAKTTAELYVFQRTPNYSVPARNRPLSDAEYAELHTDYAARREEARNSEAGVPMPAPTKATFDVDEDEREAMYESGWQRGGINSLSYAFTDYFKDDAANRTAQDFVRRKIAETVHDHAVARALSPTYHIGTRRTCVDTGYYQSFNQPNVHLVDISGDRSVAIDADGIQTPIGHFDLDVIIFAVGFDAITGPITAIDITGRVGRRLAHTWTDGPRTYLGLATAGFPNLFFVTGPGSPSVLSNMVVSIEQHVDWIAGCLDHATAGGRELVEATPEAQDQWVEHVAQVGAETLYPRAYSWYTGANIEGKARVFMPYVGGVGQYRKECDAVAASGYVGFRICSRTDSLGGSGSAGPPGLEATV